MYPHNLSNIAVQLSGGRRRLRIFAPNVKNSHSRKRSWWKKFFFDDEGNWLGLKDDDILEGEEFDGSSEQELSEGEKFEAWKRRAEAIIELREAQADLRNQENCRWEDWLVDETNDVNSSSWENDRHGKSREDAQEDPSELILERGLVKSLRDLVLGTEDEDMLYEDRVFRYASINSVTSFALFQAFNVAHSSCKSMIVFSMLSTISSS
ncbi:Kinesin-like protein [Actinidia chinensis var. chinensis]|uniref:Kinesin-like protein n=1 Tax=Actinidia chinensis var. chinensis TaxID=1590841 RepID=A0A2R6P4Y6_ACTCC|nr:Kinesin-like protein [Actinidia chinensis var. chinensis]